MKLLLTSHGNSPHLGQPVLLRRPEHPCWDLSAEQSHVFHWERLKEEKDPMLLHGDYPGHPAVAPSPSSAQIFPLHTVLKII